MAASFHVGLVLTGTLTVASGSNPLRASKLTNATLRAKPSE
jgi:hypothetical protein